jgi:hypothetical protein
MRSRLPVIFGIPPVSPSSDDARIPASCHPPASAGTTEQAAAFRNEHCVNVRTPCVFACSNAQLMSTKRQVTWSFVPMTLDQKNE